ncbi:hypothetical protein Tco_0272881 [Tanacetum coccineum]
MSEINQSVMVTLNDKSYSVKVLEDRFQASILLPSQSLDDPNHDDILSSFEEEFVGTSVAADGGGEDEGSKHENGYFAWDNEKVASFISPMKSSRVSDEVNFKNDCNNDKSGFSS